MKIQTQKVLSNISQQDITNEYVSCYHSFGYGSPYDCMYLSIDISKEEFLTLFKIDTFENKGMYCMKTGKHVLDVLQSNWDKSGFLDKLSHKNFNDVLEDNFFVFEYVKDGRHVFYLYLTIEQVIDSIKSFFVDEGGNDYDEADEDEDQEEDENEYQDHKIIFSHQLKGS